MESRPPEIEIVFENDDFVAINKPHGLLVHRTKIADDAEFFALQLVRNKVKKRVYPIHRLDRKTSGVLLFAKSREVNSMMHKLFHKRVIQKTYLAVVRGFTDDEGEIDYPLEKNSIVKEAVTTYKALKRYELDIPSGKFETSRYSLLEVKPKTGRFHQIRKHMAHILHPIIGDRPHGCNKQNKLWKEKYGMTTMLLHAKSLCFDFPGYDTIQINAEPSGAFQHALDILNENSIIQTDSNQIS